MTNGEKMAMMIAIKHAEQGGGGVQEGGTWLDREIGHNPADWLLTKSGHKFCDQFQRLPRTAGNFTNPTEADKGEKFVIDHHNSKAVVLIISHKYNIE